MKTTLLLVVIFFDAVVGGGSKQTQNPIDISPKSSQGNWPIINRPNPVGSKHVTKVQGPGDIGEGKHVEEQVGDIGEGKQVTLNRLVWGMALQVQDTSETFLCLDPNVYTQRSDVFGIKATKQYINLEFLLSYCRPKAMRASPTA